MGWEMDPITALHTRARMFGTQVHPVDQDLPDAGTRNAIVRMIRNFVELYTPKSFASLEEARETLAWLATTHIPQAIAQNRAEHARGGGLSAGAPTHGWRWGWGAWLHEWSPKTLDPLLTGFADYVRNVPLEELWGIPIERLTFQRTLTDADMTDAYGKLRARWGIEDFYWYPLDREEADDPPPHTIAFDSAAFFDEDAEAADLLLRALRPVGGRVLQLSDGDEPDRERAFERVAEFAGDWTIMTDTSFDWVVYVSHEDSVTVAGQRLLPALQSVWPSWNDWTRWKFQWH
jgi:hypothetical protein